MGDKITQRDALSGILSDPLLTPEQVADALGVTTGTLQNWRVNGRYKLPFIKLGGGNRMVRYRLSAVQRFVDSQAIGGAGHEQTRALGGRA
ncbi:MAG TPA: helix-turn-helix domain-containing protein [Candidatus Krumholzibacteria bacterium]|nr:helix-turn-helix domain-containing protein [Candidatus Krumholzibacteria bacterium]HRX52424.1 helix-turn-helix domain-containing protein [Candidatus Krumholzibacteria bacterium]